MSKYNQNHQPSVRGPHPDYERNLAQAERFCLNVEKTLHEGMRVRIEDSHALKRALLMISWMPPRNAPVGNFANPVFLHQSKTEYDREVVKVFNSYMARAKAFWQSWKLKEEDIFTEAANE